MIRKVYKNKRETSKKAAERAISILNSVIAEKGEASFVMATGNSQLDFIDYLVQDDTVDWSKTNLFHLDEYIGISDNHVASFRKYLKEKFISKKELGSVNLINGMVEPPEKECERLNRILAEEEIDVSFVGIGENGHLAFNDPPADFEIEDPFIIVELNEDCRKQQVGEGWFSSIEEVPERAISMSVKQIMKSKNIICTVPGIRKAQAVKDCFDNDRISSEYPASILKKHDQTYLYLDQDSASLIDK